MNVLTNALIALGAVGVVGYALITPFAEPRPTPARQGGRRRRKRQLFGYHERRLLAGKLVLQRQCRKLNRQRQLLRER